MNKKYLEKLIENPLPELPEDERIYFNVDYAFKGVAKCFHCRWDPVRKLWFTGCLNRKLFLLTKTFTVNEITSEKALALMERELQKREEGRPANR